MRPCYKEVGVRPKMHAVPGYQSAAPHLSIERLALQGIPHVVIENVFNPDFQQTYCRLHPSDCNPSCGACGLGRPNMMPRDVCDLYKYMIGADTSEHEDQAKKIAKCSNQQSGLHYYSV